MSALDRARRLLDQPPPPQVPGPLFTLSSIGGTPMTTRPPIVGAALWSAVMKNADHRCECRGACGRKHDPERTRQQGRCPRVNGEYVSKVGEVVLIAMPRDPVNEGSFAIAAQLPARRLAAMCRTCHDAVLSKIRRAAKQLPPQEQGLFDPEPYRADPTAARQAEVGRA